MDANVNLDMRTVGRIECRPSRASIERAIGKHVVRLVPPAEPDPQPIGLAADSESLRWPPRVFPGL